MRGYEFIVKRLCELVGDYEVTNSDIVKSNIQGMIESLYWVVKECVDNDLKMKIENII